MTVQKILYSKSDAAEMLSIGVRTLERLIADKEIPVRRVGSRVLIHHAAIEQFAGRGKASVFSRHPQKSFQILQAR